MTKRESRNRAVGYARVSTEQQADSGLSLEHQDTKIRAMAAVQDAELADVIVDSGASAKTLDRPGMARLLALVEARQIDAVIVTKLDRLTRNVRDLGELLERFQRRNVRLVSVSESLDTSTAAGRLVLNIMGSVSQWEREAIGERTRDALHAKRVRGERAGTEPFGFRVNGDGRTLHPYGPEQQMLAMIDECRAAGFTLRETAAELNRTGHTTRTGQPWQHQHVHSILRNASRHQGNDLAHNR
jgi:site-specific DNA recombinase